MMKSKASAALLRLKEIDKKYKIRYEETKKEELSSENTESLVRQSVEGQNNTQSASEVEEKEIFKPTLSIKIPETFNEQLESHSSSNEASISARVSIVDKTLKGDKNIESQSLSEIEEQLEDADSISEVLDDTENSDEKIAEKKSKEEIEKIETKDFPLKLAEKHISVQEKQLENYSSIENDAHWNDYFNSSFESYSSVYESQSIQEAIINSNSALSSNRNDDYVGRKDILDTSIVAEEVEKKKEEMGANFAEKVEKTKEEMRASFAENVEKKKEEITEKLGKNNEEKKIEILENEDEEIVEESLNSIEATNSMRNSLSSESESEKLNSKRSNLEINKQKKVDSKKNDSSIDSKLSKDDIKSEKSERKRKKLKESEKSLSGKSEISLKSLSNTNSSIIQSSKDQREKNYSESADKIEKNDSEEKSSSEKDNFLHEKLDKIRITNEQSGYKTKHESLKLLRESRRDRKKSSDYSEEIGKLPKNNDELSESRSRQKRSKQKSRLSKSSTCCRVNKIPEIKRKDIELERFNMRLMNLRLEQERQLMLCYMKNFEDDRDKFLQWPDQFYSARISENPIIKPLNFQNVLNFAKPDSDSTKEQFNFPDNHLAMMKNRVIEIRQWLKDQFIIYQNYSGIAAAINAKYITESKKIEIESMSRYVSPINPAVFPVLAIVLLGIGIFFTAWFFVYEVTSTKFTRDIFKELLVSLVAAIFSGFGVLFLLLWVGIYV